MIRPAPALLKRRGAETGAVTLLLALSFVLPGVFAMCGIMAMDAASSWLKGYRPIVYFALDVSEDQIKETRTLLNKTHGVASVVRRSPAQALAALRTRLGDEHVMRLGLSEAMLPTSLVVEPFIPLHGHIDLVARIGSLEARPFIESVDIPGSQSLRLLKALRIGATVLGVLLALFLCASCVLAMALLRRVRDDELCELELLEIFGASRRELAKPTAMRGLWLGLWSGGGATLLLLVFQMLAQGQAEVFGGVGPAHHALSWLITLSPLLLLPVLGVLMGKFASRPPRVRHEPALPLVKSMLYFGMRKLAM